MKISSFVLRGLVLSAIFTSAAAPAALVLFNGDFEIYDGEGIQEANVHGWFDSNAGGFWEAPWQTNTGGASPNGTRVVVFSAVQAGSFGAPPANLNDGAYLYQGIGTAGGVPALKVDFEWGTTPDDTGGRNLGMTVGIYAYSGTGTFVPSDNVDVRGQDGVTLLSSQTFTILGTTAGSPFGPESAVLSLAGAGEQQLFLRFSSFFPSEGSNPWPALDNVSIAPVPEPSVALLGILGTAAFLRRRR